MGDKKMKKLKNILGEVFEETPKVDKHKVVEGVKNYGIVGKSLYSNNNVMEIAKQLAQVAESAHHHILGEESDWFDKISVNRNMKQLKGNVMEFTKTAKEAHSLNQRLTSLYEDIGHVLNRYYEIDEIVEDKGDMDNDGKDEPDSEEYMDNKDKAIKKAMKKEDKGDMDNDGKNEPDDEEYMDNKDKAIKKAMSKTEESLNKRPIKKLKDIGSVAGIPSLGALIKNK